MISLQVQAGALFGSLVLGALFFLLYDLFNRLFYHYQGSLIRLPFELSMFSLFGFSYFVFLAKVTDGIYNIFYFLFLLLGATLYYKFYHIHFLRLIERFYLFLRLKIGRRVVRWYLKHYYRYKRALKLKLKKRRTKNQRKLKQKRVTNKKTKFPRSKRKTN